MILVTATKTEALPLIEALNLTKIAQKPFTLYANSAYRLVISGIGTIKATSALSFTLAQRSEKVCNIGYAAGNEIGALFHIHKVIDSCTNKVYHLSKSSILPNAACTTFPKPINKKITTLADMEASALVVTARLFQVDIQILKIVSDNFNQKECAHNSQLIEKNIDTLLSQI